MELVLDIAYVLALTLLAMLVLVLFAPLHLRASGDVDLESLHAAYRIRLRWALGVLGLDLASGERPTLRLFGLPIARFASDSSPSKAARKARKEKQSPRPRTRRGQGALWLLRRRQDLWRLALRLLSTLHLRARIAGAIGLPEPDDSVWLALALDQLEARLPESTLAVEVDYSDAVFDLEGSVTAWAIPLHVLVVGLALYLFTDLGRAVRGDRARSEITSKIKTTTGPNRATETTP